MKIRFGTEIVFLVLFISLFSVSAVYASWNPVGPETVFNGPLPVIVASLVYCAVVGVGKVMQDD
jgi:hypothetical protein